MTCLAQLHSCQIQLLEMASVLSRSSLRLLWLPKPPLELSLVKQSSAASAANQKYLSDLDSIKEVRPASQY